MKINYKNVLLKISWIFVFTYLFLLVYAPRFISINTIHILAVIAVIGIFFNLKRSIYVIKRCSVLQFSIITLIGGLLVITAGVFNNQSTIQLYRFFLLGIEVPLCVLFIITYMQKNSFTYTQFLHFIVAIGVVQGLIAVLMLVSPDFKALINNHYAQFWDTRYMGWSINRMYGFSDNLLHTTPLVQAIIAMLVVILATKNKWLLIFFPVLLLSIAVNARTALFLLIFCMIAFVFSMERLDGKRKVITLGVLVFAIFVPIVLGIFSEYSPIGYEYLLSGFTEFFDFLGGTSSGNSFFKRFFNEFLVFPEGIGLLFGYGIQIQGTAGASYNVSSDTGFINDIWSGGLIFAALITIEYLWMIYKIRESKMEGSKLLSLVFLFAFLMGHLKGSLTYYNDYTVLLLLIVCAKVLDFIPKLDKVQ